MAFLMGILIAFREQSSLFHLGTNSLGLQTFWPQSHWSLLLSLIKTAPIFLLSKNLSGHSHSHQQLTMKQRAKSRFCTHCKLPPNHYIVNKLGNIKSGVEWSTNQYEIMSLISLIVHQDLLALCTRHPNQNVHTDYHAQTLNNPALLRLPSLIRANFSIK